MERTGYCQKSRICFLKDDRLVKSSKSSLDTGSKVANVASYVLIGRVINFLFLGIALILVTRLLGPAQYGVYTLAVAFAGIFSTFAYVGIGTTLSKLIPEFLQQKRFDDVNHIVSNAFFLIVFTGIVLTAICFIFSGFLSNYIFHTAAMYQIIQLASLWILSSMLFGVFYDALVGFGNGKHIAVLLGVQTVLQSVISISLAFGGFMAAAPIFGLVIGYAAAAFMGVYLVYRVHHVSWRWPSFKHMHRLLDFSVPIAASNVLSSTVSNFALIFLGYFVTNALIGNIGITSRTGLVINVIFDSLGFAILPTFSAVISNKKTTKDIGRIYSYTVYLAILLVSPLLFYVIFLSGTLSTTLFGGAYMAAPTYISILSLGLLIGIVGTYGVILLTGAGKVKLVFKYNILVYGLTALFYIALIPLLHALGYAIVAFLIVPILIDIAAITIIRKFFKVDFRTGKLARIVLANIITCVVLILVAQVISGIPLLVVSAILYLIIYPVLSIKLSGVEKSDINTIRSLSQGVPIFGSMLISLMNYADMII